MSSANEFDEAVSLSDRILEAPSLDPDGIMTVLSRQFRRALERADKSDALLRDERVPGPCGHPKACQKPLRMADNLDEGPQLYECTVCAELASDADAARERERKMWEPLINEADRAARDLQMVLESDAKVGGPLWRGTVTKDVERLLAAIAKAREGRDAG
jgi:hypothetical protein